MEQIPVTIVNYGRDLRRKSSFFVYGTEREVFFPESANTSDSASQTSESSSATTESKTSQNYALQRHNSLEN